MKRTLPTILLGLFSSIALSSPAIAHNHISRSVPSQWKFSYQYMFMDMDGSRDGTEDLSDKEVLEEFPVTPTRMIMQGHMLGVMYMASPDWSVMAMLPYLTKEMDFVTRSGQKFTTNSEGFGDLKLTGAYNAIKSKKEHLQFKFGVSFPTGSIEEKDDTPAGDDQILAYPMQIGSGTVDIYPSIAYVNRNKEGAWGASASTVLRLGENNNNYRLGNEFSLSGWVKRNWTDEFASSIRLEGKTIGNIDGEDPRLNPNLVPNADPDLQGETRLDLALGVEFSPKKTKLGLEFAFPLYQSLDGPQLETDWQLRANLQRSF